jgi:hypothetical protein
MTESHRQITNKASMNKTIETYKAIGYIYKGYNYQGQKSDSFLLWFISQPP